ncbi:hypothetical protein A6856_23855 [Salmonella enterica]|nr:hypothetical protein [Salmonella enterica]EAS2027931.1 hypothetical protein [Salmonella enterica]EAU0259670.1 hypothetical protein [Salmonella enterica]
MNITDLVNYFTIAGALSTIVATMIAFIAFINWRKQQAYSLQLSLLLDLEDKFTIYIAQNMEDFNTFWQAYKCIRNNKDQDKKVIDDTIKKHFSERLDKEKTAKAQFEVQVALLRAARMIEEIKCNHTSILTEIDILNKKYIYQSDIEDSLKQYIEEITGVKDEFIDVLTRERNKLGKISLKKALCF